jgi:hypothetical protein
MFVEVEDIAERLWYRKHAWREPDPEVTLAGEPGHFGRLVFHFTAPVGWNIYIASEAARKDILAMAKMTLFNYDTLVNHMF